MKTLICNCNRTMPLDAAALTKALGPQATNAESRSATSAPDSPLVVHTLLCRREAPAFQRAAKSGEDLLVACTQEARLFLELNEQTEGAMSLAERPIRFVNIREMAGWSKDAAQATPKVAALLAAAQLPAPDPVATVAYRSAGRCLVIGPAEAAERAATLLGPGLTATLLVAGGGALPQRRDRPVHAGRLTRLQGWLGNFQAQWTQHNPIDLDLCTRCNACIEACPEGAIDFSYQIDLGACKAHRDCVRVCEAAGAIDFQRPAETFEERFDLVLDLRPEPAFTQHAKPQGYVHARSESQWLDAVLALRDWVGEFDKPKFFHYRQKLCAHSRNETVGCSACIDVCSASAIRSDASMKGKALGQARRGTSPVAPVAGGLGGGIVVEAALCVGCGACTTVCPSGALSYATPTASDQGRSLRTMLSTYARAGGRDAAVLLHSQGAGTRVLEELGRAARVDAATHGLPARVLPLAVWHTASVGLDLWLSALAFGASQVWVLLTEEEAPEYHTALAEQMAVAQALLTGLGYTGTHLRLLQARDARDLAALDKALRDAPARTVAQAASFAVQGDKRGTLELALDHLQAQAPNLMAARAEAVALPAVGSPLGSLVVDADKCTLCLACVGACPQSALADNPEAPQLRFTEKNCVQCGLCVKTCPEGALALQPRLWLAEGGRARKQPRVIAEAKPYACVRCGKPFGTLKAIEAMMAKLAGHSMFQGAAAERLKMCGDCRVIDIHTNPNETRITDL